MNHVLIIYLDVICARIKIEGLKNTGKQTKSNSEGDGTIDKQTQKTLFSSDKNYWETPQNFFDQLNEKYHFTLDAAASHENHKCDRYFTEDDDGLLQDWGGETVFCNPPYGNKETGEWTKKCFEEAQKPDTTVVLLIPARTDRHSFHDYIYNKPGVTISFLPGRLAFEINGEPIRDDKGSAMKAPFPSMVIEFKNIQYIDKN